MQLEKSGQLQALREGTVVMMDTLRRWLAIGAVICFGWQSAAAETAVPVLTYGVSFTPSALAVLGDGSTVLTGSEGGEGGRSRLATARYLPDGTLDWLRLENDIQYPDEKHNDLIGRALAVDRQGGIVVAAATECYARFHSAVTVARYDAAGSGEWVKLFARKGYNNPFGLVVDSSGGVAIPTFGFNDGNDQAPQAWLVRFSAGGEPLAPQSMGEPFTAGLSDLGTDGRLAAAFDASGNLLVTGPAGTAKFDSVGTRLWLVPAADMPVAGGSFLAADGAGGLFVTGAGGTARFDAYGNRLWLDLEMAGRGLALDRAGNLYVTGRESTRKYTPGGTLRWALGMPATAIGVDDKDSVFLLQGATVQKFAQIEN
jgi:hypothetical protein